MKETIEQQMERLLKIIKRGTKDPVHAVQELVVRLDPEDQIALFDRMGMKRVRREHAHNCDSVINDFWRCNCTPPQSMWTAPAGVRKHLKEKFQDRVDFGIRRQEYLNDGVGKSPGRWAIDA